MKKSRTNNKFINLALILSLLITFNSCSIFKSKTEKENNKLIENLTDLQKEIVSNYTSFNTIETKAKLKLKEPKSISLKSTIRITKDKSIWISASFFGIEGARILIDENKISALDKVNKKHYVLDYDKWNKKNGTSFSLKHFENLLLGRFIEPINKDSKVENIEQGFRIENEITKDKFWLEYLLLNNLLRQQNLRGSNQALNINLLYSADKYKNIIPKEQTLTVKGKTNIKADIQIQSVSINKDFSTPFKISSKYEKVEL